MGEQQILAALIRQQLGALVEGEVAPAHQARLQAEIVGRVLVGGELDPGLGIALVAGRPDRQPVVAGGQVRHLVVPLRVGEHAHGDLGRGVAGLHEGAAERRTVRPRDRAGDGGGIGGRGGQGHETENSKRAE